MFLCFLLNSSHRSKPLFIFPLLILLLFVPMLSAKAAPGDLDPSFAGGGISQSAGTDFFSVTAIAVQPDGKIIAGGLYSPNQSFPSAQFALVRYLSNGLIDPSFGINGMAITNFQEYQAFSIVLKDIAILPNGKVVAVGSGRVPVQGFPINTTDLFVVRYNSNGSLDTTFNNTGKFRSRVDFFSSGEAIAVQSDGKFVVAGYGGSTFKGPRIPYKILLYRFSDFGLDSSFGNGGQVVTPFQNGDAEAYSIAIQPNGKIVVGGTSFNASIFGLSLTRFESNGSLDLSFGDNGFVIFSNNNLDYVSDVVIQPDAKIIAVAASQNTNNNLDFAVFRFDENGSSDSSFGTNGKVTTDISGVADKANAVVLQPDGKIIVAGFSYNYTTNSNLNPALVRYNPNGSLDPTFGNGGIVTKPAGYSLSDLALQADGKILAVSGSRVIRYLGDAPFNLRRTNFDFDGDGWADFAVTRAVDANFNWYALKNPSGELLVNTEWGAISDLLAPADYDGDRKTDVAIFRPSEGAWYILKSTDNTVSFVRFGQSGDIPTPSDFDGDGRADNAVFRNGNWYILNSSDNSFRAEQFGSVGDKPVLADFDGDGRTDISVYRNGIWYAQRSSAGFFAVTFGLSTDVPVPADYDGDGKTDLAVFRPDNGAWYLLNSSEGFKALQFGIATDQPVPADYDGDGKANIAVFRSGIWFVQNSNGDLRSVYFGSDGDKAVQTAFQR